MIDISYVKVEFNGKVVLGPLSVTLSAGRTHAVIGTSGCGKTTLLRAIMGFVVPVSGTILMGTHGVRPHEFWAGQRSKMGYVVQSAGLFPNMTVKENIELMAMELQVDPGERKVRLNDLLDLVRLDASLLDRFPHELSGGQKQRVGLVRALFLDPDYLFLDEPLAALDPLVRSDLQGDLKAIFEELRKTVILVTHDLGEAAFLGETITLLDEGLLQQHDDVEKLLKYPKNEFVKGFLNAQRPVPKLAEMST